MVRSLQATLFALSLIAPIGFTGSDCADCTPAEAAHCASPAPECAKKCPSGGGHCAARSSSSAASKTRPAESRGFKSGATTTTAR